jgi:hypothetical protein
LEKGLIPNFQPFDQIVQKASQRLDSIKPAWIPKWVKRTDALYLFPEMPTDFLWEMPYQSSDLYAVKLPHTKGWMGSQLYAGFFLNYADMEELEEEVGAFLKEDVGKKYWNYSCSLEDYIKYDCRVRKKDRYVQKFNEILFFGSIPPENIELIGQWDHDIFTSHDSFEKYVKEEYKQDYMKILKLV